MSLSFRHFKQILSTWVSYVTGHSQISDTNPGSVVRTIGEAFSLELSQGYVQIQSLRNLFSLDLANGDDLDERALDYSAARLSPQQAVGVVAITDSNVTTTAYGALLSSRSAGSTDIVLAAGQGASFTAPGSVVLDADNSQRELVPFTAVSGDTLTLGSALANAHQVGASVALSTVGTDRPIAKGTAIYTSGNTPQRFKTSADTVLQDGYATVTQVPIVAANAGASGNVKAGTLVNFDTPPFPGATVTNSDPTLNGADRETDENFRSRIKDAQQNLSSSTLSRIESEALKVVVPSTNQRVISAKLVEPVSPGVCLLYVTDGTAGFVATQQDVTTTELVVSDGKIGQTRAKLQNWPVIENSANLYCSKERGTFTAVAGATATDSTKSWTTNQWAGFLLKDAAGNFFTVASNTATVLTVTGGTPALSIYALINTATTAYPAGSRLVQDTDYTLNETNGDFQLTSTSFPTGLMAHDCLLALAQGGTPGYSYVTGLLQLVQRTINGFPQDLDDFPGVKAAGTQIRVLAPSVLTTPITGTIVPEPGVDETTLRLPVQQAIVAYINSLGIAEDELTSRIVQAAVGVTGVFDFQLSSPSANVTVGNDQIARISLSDVLVN